ncbi:MAG: NUDIX domain-containing protein [Brachybacterium tyrofermentans]|uniref:NUDIX domain-containing protein n=1 Tax=Brachybacterium tyrofermentans TaxID=47848 RepID=UPI001D021374|nr:NUDIX domain-containing protein [Brachybacterium tyrofermentans]
MTLEPSDDAVPAEFREHRWQRGTCPRCGGGQVLHRVIGMPVPGAMESSPSWVVWAGCTGLGPDRECGGCGHSWWAHDVGFADDEEEPEDPAPLRVVGAVIVRDDRFLAARRRPGKSAGGRWEFPGGKIEPGESPQQALIRELREELGVEVTVGWLLGRGEADAGDRDLHLDCYWTRLDHDGPLASTDHDRLEWVTRDQLATRDWADADVPVVAQILEGAEPRFDRR